jgi:hypothetical protein
MQPQTKDLYRQRGTKDDPSAQTQLLYRATLTLKYLLPYSELRHLIHKCVLVEFKALSQGFSSCVLRKPYVASRPDLQDETLRNGGLTRFTTPPLTQQRI